MHEIVQPANPIRQGMMHLTIFIYSPLDSSIFFVIFYDLFHLKFVDGKRLRARPDPCIYVVKFVSFFCLTLVHCLLSPSGIMFIIISPLAMMN